MNELISALTRAATAVAVYYEYQNAGAPEKDFAAVDALHTATVDKTTYALSGEPALKKKAAKKAAPSEPVISEDESLPIALATAKEFVQRFSNAKPLDGLTQARAILAEHFKVGAIPALSHEQRVELIGILKAKLEVA